MISGIKFNNNNLLVKVEFKKGKDKYLAQVLIDRTLTRHGYSYITTVFNINSLPLTNKEMEQLTSFAINELEKTPIFNT